MRSCIFFVAGLVAFLLAAPKTAFAQDDLPWGRVFLGDSKMSFQLPGALAELTNGDTTPTDQSDPMSTYRIYTYQNMLDKCTATFIIGKAREGVALDLGFASQQWRRYCDQARQKGADFQNVAAPQAMQIDGQTAFWATADFQAVEGKVRYRWIIYMDGDTLMHAALTDGDWMPRGGEITDHIWSSLRLIADGDGLAGEPMWKTRVVPGTSVAMQILRPLEAKDTKTLPDDSWAESSQDFDYDGPLAGVRVTEYIARPGTSVDEARLRSLIQACRPDPQADPNVKWEFRTISPAQINDKTLYYAVDVATDSSGPLNFYTFAYAEGQTVLVATIYEKRYAASKDTAKRIWDSLQLAAQS